MAFNVLCSSTPVTLRKTLLDTMNNATHRDSTIFPTHIPQQEQKPLPSPPALSVVADRNLEPVTVLHATPFFPIPKVYQRCQLASLMLYFLSSDISLTTCLLVIGRYRKIFGYMTRSATRVLGASLYKGLCWLRVALRPVTPIFASTSQSSHVLTNLQGRSFRAFNNSHSNP